MCQGSNFFLEVFSGTGNLTRSMRKAGWNTLPPIDNVIAGVVLESVDVLDPQIQLKIEAWLRSGKVKIVHFGTPCTTFSIARRYDGGPPPLRSKEFLTGVPGLSFSDMQAVQLGTRFLEISLLWGALVLAQNGFFSLENPESSMLWLMPQIVDFVVHWCPVFAEVHMCQYGSKHKKPTSFMHAPDFLAGLSRSCPGSTALHVHEELSGKVQLADGSWIYKTKLAQVYPEALCDQFAQCCAPIKAELLAHSASAPCEVPDPFLLGSSDMAGAQFCTSFRLVTPAHERKRPVGSVTKVVQHRQARSGRQAISSGYQMKRGLVEPLFTKEPEPGEAIQIAMDATHPFSIPIELDDQMLTNIELVTRSPEWVNDQRKELIRVWQERAEILLPVSLEELDAIPDQWTRRLLRGAPDDQIPVLGEFFHVALWREMAHDAEASDSELIGQIMHGMPIVGEILRSGRWPEILGNDRQQAALTEFMLKERAWEIRMEILTGLKRRPVGPEMSEILKAAQEDVREGSCVGPFSDVEGVSQFLGTSQWIPTQRFPVLQKSKVRGCDSATVNGVNQAAVITEKLQLPSTDYNVAVIRRLWALADNVPLQGWVLDERKAYRQIPIRAEHRMFSVVAFKDPGSHAIVYFVMIGHSFGLVSAVYNYNRRSALLNEFLQKIFGLVSFSYYDDKYGFETERTIGSAHEVAQFAHRVLGAKFDLKKLQSGPLVEILGVTYNFLFMTLEIKDDRKADLTEEIKAILEADHLDPGHAGKLKGKLMFAASQLWGKVGRAFLLAISERQYMKFRMYRDEKLALGTALRRALEQWLRLIKFGPPRELTIVDRQKSDVVLFTDGSYPDDRKGETKESQPPRIGAVLFSRVKEFPLQGLMVVPDEVITKWLPRKNQICMIELLATVAALWTFRHYVRDKFVLLLIDSEVVEAALIKGYSSREDVCELVGVFWELALQLKVQVYIDRVPTDANPSDGPSRGKLQVGEDLGWVSTQLVLPKMVMDRGMSSGKGPGSVP